ncbi:F-box only protein 43 [Spea bombifrons]|uniref:F-box only protein 43 n=1 Tax=Spea bombifrons TaxID=233779 RepID=UPI00234903D9|nr:F-box only protein 43 [Spea bombifrons]
MEAGCGPGCWGFFCGVKAYNRKKQDMASNRATLECLPRNITRRINEGKMQHGYADTSSCVSQDSGYDSLKSFSPHCGESSSKSLGKTSLTHECENSENIDPTLVLSPISGERAWEPKQMTSGIYETPRVIKRDFSLRRRLLLSKATSGGNLDFDALDCSAKSSERKKSLQRCPTFEDHVSKAFSHSPRDPTYKPIATSTLKADAESGTSCKKWRLSFAQQRTSTFDDSKCDGVPFPEVENLSPVQHSSDSVTDDSILSINEENLTELPETPICNLISRAKEEFQTPISSLVAKFNFDLCTPTGPVAVDLDSSAAEDSAFHSLSFDKSQDSLTDHEGSFQELIQKQKETPKAVQNKNRLRKLERCKRLSTLRERGSQSEVEEEWAETQLLSFEYKSKVARESVDEEVESSLDDCREGSLLKIEDLTGTPALRIVREMFVRSSHKRKPHASVQDILGSLDSSELSDDSLTRLIGRKMGLENLDILAELKYRNLKHVIACIFDSLNVESLCSVWKVSKEWREIVVQDKSAHQRRKVFLKKQRAEAQDGRSLSSEDAATRLNLLSRSALKCVQAQARSSFQTPNSTFTPKDTSAIAHSSRKQQEYVKVAKTLFTDEALKPCPRCQYPAKYQPLKKQGTCSRKDCGFNFCGLCLCAFHGSKECGGGSAKRIHKKDAPPGSAQSKRNLRRL